MPSRLYKFELLDTEKTDATHFCGEMDESFGFREVDPADIPLDPNNFMAHGF
jgi:hypothetical protein